ncbi:MAG: restriction endonuclease [Acidimicrobiia bacterium]
MTKPDPPTWLEFEQLAAQIYTLLVPKGADVRHNDHIRGHDSGIERQIDVSIRFEVAGHSFLTIVQARDLATPADVNVVGEFVSVVKDVKANKGVLICRSGFTVAAQTMARTKGIDLCNIHDASSEKWALEIRVPIIWIDLEPIARFAGTVDLKGGDSIEPSLDRWIISSDQGKTRVLPLATFERMWNENELSREPGKTHRLHGPGGLSVRVLDINGEIAWRAIDFTVEYTVGRRAWLGTFSPEECLGLLNYEDGSFVGQFPVGSIPCERGEDWTEIDPEEMVANVRGAIVTTQGWQLVEGSARTKDLVLRSEETGHEIRPPQS